jgi:signal transduction histidine kinase
MLPALCLSLLVAWSIQSFAQQVPTQQVPAHHKPPAKATTSLFAEYALPRPTFGTPVVDSLTALLPRKQGRERLVVLNELTRGYLWQSLDFAKQYQAEALALAGQLRDSVGYAEALINTANIQRFASEGDQGFQTLQNALALCLRIGYKGGAARAMYGISIIFSVRGEILPARTYLLQALSLADSLGDVEIAARVNNSISIDYFEQGDEAKSLEYSLRSLALHRREKASLHRDFNLLIQLNNVGVCYQENKQYSSALRYYKEGHELILSHGWRLWYRMANSCGNLAELYRLMGRYDEAILWGKRAVFEEYQTMERTHNTLLGRGAFVGSVFRKLAETYQDAGKTDSALIFYNKIFDFPGSDDWEIVEINAAISAVHRERGEVRQAIIYACRARDLAEKLPRLRIKVLAAKTMAEAFSAAKQFDTAFVYATRYALLNDSLRNIDIAKQTERLQARFDITVKQKENDLLKRENEMKELVISRQTWIVLGVAAFLAITIVLVVLLYRGNNRRQRDNARLAELNDKLFDANEELSLLTSEKDEILNIVSHGLKSQIFGVRSLADSMTSALADATFPNNPAPLAEMSRSISRSGAQMFSLVTNLLTVNTAEQGLLKPMLVETDVGAVLNNVCEEFKEIAAVKNITLSVDAPEKERVFANADEQMLREALGNLVSNAIKYSPHGKSVWVRVHHLSFAIGHRANRSPNAPTTKQPMTNAQALSNQAPNAQAPNNFLRIEVADEGPGISAEDQTKLFGKFTRLSAQPTGGEHSSGLGLSIVKKLVEAMNGRVWCESELGKGATFVVELPVGSSGHPAQT